MMTKVERLDGKPAGGLALWCVDHSLRPEDRHAMFQEGPNCRTDAAGLCEVTVKYHYCETLCPWDRPSQPDYTQRFEMVTVRNGRRKSLGFLQGVHKVGTLLEGTLWVRLD
jgi:hypothetical protein